MTIFKHNAGAIVILLLVTASCSGTQSGDFAVSPLPQEIDLKDGAPFVFGRRTAICAPEALRTIAELLADDLEEATGRRPKVSDTKGNIILSTDVEYPAEGYRIDCSKDRIAITGGSAKGVFYGTQTLYKALPVSFKGSAALPAAVVEDAPEYPYRGFMIDVGRHFFPVDYLEELIDIMALHNINVFHWHLTEDQGWRIPVPGYPKLTEVGSYRPGTIIEPGSTQYDTIPVQGFYTREEMEHLVRYAADRQITVIPEIDMPGHMLAALASYPELGCTGGPYEVTGRFGVFADVLCPGKDATLDFARAVLKEVMEIFPSEYIHLGGDECPKERWKECPDCQARIRKLGLKDMPGKTKENQLQTWFMGQMQKYMEENGRKMMGWDEVLEGTPNEDVTVCAWTSPAAIYRSASEGHPTVACPIQHLYFSNRRFNELTGRESIGRVYGLDIVPPQLSPDQRQNIIGAEACIWTEWVADTEKMEWEMLPRIAALSELQWGSERDLDAFLPRLRKMTELYDRRGWNWKKDIAEAWEQTP